MSSYIPLLTDGGICKHGRDEYRIGCLSCGAKDTRSEIDQANKQLEERKEAAGRCEKLLQDGKVKDDDRPHYEAELALARSQQSAWENRLHTLKEVIAAEQRQIKEIVHMTGSGAEAIAQAFEAHAIERYEELEEAWKNSSPDDSKLVKFDQKEPDAQAEFGELDRSQVPATPDCLVSDGVGLQMALKIVQKLVGGRRLTHAVGEQLGEPKEAVMSYGAALAMFGLPGAPGENKPKKTDEDADRTVEESMAACTIDETATHEPKTELERRVRDDMQSRKPPAQSEDSQWETFASNRYLADISILARQYVKLVARKAEQLAKEKKEKEMKEREENEKKETKEKKQKQKQKQEEEKGEPSGESPAAGVVVPKSSSDYTGGWPPVDELDWIGFTNWVHECKKLDPTFKKGTLKSWHAQRTDRANVVEQLRNWAPPTQFQDGLSYGPTPDQFFAVDESIPAGDQRHLGNIDLEYLGLKKAVQKRR